MLKETPSMLSLFLIGEISLNNDIWFQNKNKFGDYDKIGRLLVFFTRFLLLNL